MDNLQKQKHSNAPIGIIHIILSYSYTVFLIAVIFGIIFDIFIPTSFFSNEGWNYLGFLLMIIGSWVVYWAQSSVSSHSKKHHKERGVEFFLSGPYKYTRIPTHIGLFVMSLGLGFLIDSLFSVLFIVLVYFLSKRIFIKRQEDILEERYGDAYLAYKNKVKK